MGATTRQGMLSAPLRSRFGLACRLDYYDAPELQQIIERSAGILNIDIDNKEFSVDVKLELVDPNGKILTETIAPLIFKKNKRQMRFVIRMDSFIYTIPGDYLYKISVKQLNDKSFKISHEIPLEVKSV